MKTKESDDQKNYKIALQEYKLELKLVYEKSQEAFEKQLSYLSAGALAFSILFIQNVIKDIAHSTLKWSLLLSWILLSITLVVNLLSHHLASKNTFKSIKEIDDGNYDSELVNKRIKQINFLNTSTLISFFFGILLLIMFVILNSMNDEINNPKTDLQKGYTPTAGPQSNHPKPQTGQNPTPPPANIPTNPVNPPKK